MRAAKHNFEKWRKGYEIIQKELITFRFSPVNQIWRFFIQNIDAPRPPINCKWGDFRVNK